MFTKNNIPLCCCVYNSYCVLKSKTIYATDNTVISICLVLSHPYVQ